MARQPDVMQYALANIEYHRVLNCMSDKDLYERAGIKKGTYWNRVNRTSRSFDLEELSRIARVFNVTVSDLVAQP